MRGLNALAAAVSAQESERYETDDYSLELPSQHWKVVRADEVECDRLFGHLRIEKKSVGEKASLDELARDQRELKLQFLRRFVNGRQEQFAGRLKGIVVNYEYVNDKGRFATGRDYYLRADEETVYVLHFTGESGFDREFRNEMDAIARTFDADD
jgi:hypothetical protein